MQEDDDSNICFEAGVTEALDSYKMRCKEVVLPEHVRCCSHTLNLVATTDAGKALADAGYKKLYRQSMSKASAVWNIVNRSTKAADAAFDILGFRLLVPCVTRWNSYYDATKKIISAESKLVELCKAVGLPPFVQTEITFLKEYVEVMAPLAASLDILQGDQQCSLGFVLPTLTILKRKLMKVAVKHTKSLRDCLIQGIDNRFGSIFSDREFLLAAVTHAKFKLTWIEDTALRAQSTQILEQAVNTFIADNPSAYTDSSTEKSDDDSDFFNFRNTPAAELSQKHLQYLNDNNKELSTLKNHPIIKKLFICYNSCIPSSAPVERLFSTAAFILTKRCNPMTDTLFEKMLLLKMNRHFQ